MYIKKEYKYGFNTNVKTKYKLKKGLSESVIRKISEIKNEPE
jgi:hypothetical protein